MKTILFVLFVVCSSLDVLAQILEIPGFISIDCGAERSYTDVNTTTPYTTDTGFTEFGQNENISNSYLNQIANQQLINMRIFPNGTRNCYTLRPKQGKNNVYLIRASFDYGSYDVELPPPVFDLYIDTNRWSSSVNSSSYITREILYVPPRDYIHVCLVNTGKGTPLISALELRLLDSSTYNLTCGALKKHVRANIGSLISYRHPEDDHDRIWGGTVFDYVITNTTNITAINTIRSNNNGFKVPVEVLATAQKSVNSSEGLIAWWSSPNPETKWIVYLHFTEVEFISNLNTTREFDVYIAGKFIATVKPEYLKPVVVASPEPCSGAPILNFSIFASTPANLPPFINAIEIYAVLDLPNTLTDLDDFNAIIAIKETYQLLQQSWQGDPCLPTNFTWTGLKCSLVDPPRIVSLNLSSSGLSGPIASSFSNLTELTSLDLSTNQLSGKLPEFFAEMPNLKIINLSGNSLTGLIPEALKKKMVDGSLQLILEGNPLCETDNCNPSFIPNTAPPSQISTPSPTTEKKNEGGNKKRGIVPVIAAVAAFALVVI